MVTPVRSGQRRIYALRADPLRELAAALGRLADGVNQLDGLGAEFDRYGLSPCAEQLAADGPRWADDRSFRSLRSLPAATIEVWRHLTESDLLTRFWAPDDLRISEMVLGA